MKSSRLILRSIAFLVLGITAATHAADFAARSPAVHFRYALPKAGEVIEWACGEAKSEPGPDKTYNCVLGFEGGYFGYQRNNPGSASKDRRFIFSLWDNGFVTKGEKTKKSAKNDDAVTTLVAKGKNVDAHDFDHEGSGGHSHWEQAWKDNETYRFLLGVKADGDAAIYTAYVQLAGKEEWNLIASFRRPNTEAKLTGIYSFVEDFGGTEPQLKRVCRFSNLWVKPARGKWEPLTEARSSVSSKPGRDDFDHRVEEDQFVLSTGGGAEATQSAGKSYSVKAAKTPPQIDFAKLPAK